MSKTGCEPHYKKTNQDNCFAFEKYITADQALFGVMDGHGPNGKARWQYYRVARCKALINSCHLRLFPPARILTMLAGRQPAAHITYICMRTRLVDVLVCTGPDSAWHHRWWHGMRMACQSMPCHANHVPVLWPCSPVAKRTRGCARWCFPCRSLCCRLCAQAPANAAGGSYCCRQQSQRQQQQQGGRAPGTA